MQSQTVRLTVDVSDQMLTEIRRIAYRQNITMTEVIRHALALEVFVYDEVIGNQAKLLVEHGNGRMLEVMIGDSYASR